ncbi:hypothetical protein IC789_05765 [Acinetobacter seifertii]|uniref:hypothetical protein n=1 Tax=Acinetobacter seifertii TaxID=1530123 RepID=UPI00168BD503|nr:hypothetical protein [Acinetobacter seifertii]HEM6824604.1 hypothetical protein [Acinetobacter baumannii]QNX11275.1 hypothetical protein IC794_14245 [Acinetobacter seifertii]QNX20824.1 hypothetical protein IC792_05780 [Acinetobacter seifertii]QNX38441.1 hypothetical protein IC789_05765 [Acinetobacter seifertii]QNX97987.1 hypothetical protein IC770_13955 [Acinetobacter seifertii]
MDNNETVTEFTKSDSITLTMQLNQDQAHLIREWSLSIPTLYMLDICVVSATKLDNAQLETNPRKAKVINILRELDRPQNSFSYLFSLMEKVSDSRGIDTEAELEAKILSDLSSLRSFFTNARIVESDEFILEFLRNLRGYPIESKRSSYIDFLRALNDQFKLGNPISPKLRLDTAKQIINLTKQFSFSKQHPIVVIALACLYGNPAAQRVLKFKDNPEKFDPENALADIMLIHRFADIQLEIEQMGRMDEGPFLRSHFITDDDGLIQILKCFTPTHVKHIDTPDGRETHTTMTVKLKDLLRDIQSEEYNHLFDFLNQN